MLTVAAVKTAGARSRAYKIADAGGLYLHVATSGRRTFRFRFRYRGREQLLTIGRFPEISLAEARTRRDTARELLRKGINPCARAQEPVLDGNTFEAAARAWHEHRRPRWSATHAADVIASLERDVFPAIGAAALAAIDAPAVLAAIRAVEARGAIETARRLRQRISAVFAFAMSEGRADADPAAIVARALQAAPAAQHHPALTEIGDVRALLAAVDVLDAAPAAKLASRFLALTAVRWAAVRGARWDEFEGLEGDAPMWRVPAARMKLTAAKKAAAANDHLVPLAPAAVAVLREIGCDARSGLVFRGRTAAGPLGEAAIGELYVRTPFAGRHVPHGWRASFATILNEALPTERDAIDRALAHAAKDKVEAAYNRAAQLARRRALFVTWADLLGGPDRGVV